MAGDIRSETRLQPLPYPSLFTTTSCSGGIPRMDRLRASGLAVIAGLMVAAPLPAQSPEADHRPQVLILGTYHFDNPGLDIAKVSVVDVLLPSRQAEIARVVDALARFRPTRIAVEQQPASASRLDSVYQAYRAGRHELTRSETQQLGFRLGAMFGHAHLYPVDHREDFPFEAMMAYAEAHDTAFVSFVRQELARIGEEAEREQRENTVGEILRNKNDPKELARDHGTYMRFAGVGAGDSFVGAELVAKWYERNIKIFANLQQIAKPGDRVLVIFGAGHVPTLRQLVDAHPGMTLVDAREYLPRF